MAKLNLSVKTGDKVVVITGKDAGKQGKVLATSPEKHRVIVEGVNIVAHHNKPRSAQDKGGIVKTEGAIDVSNVMLVCPTCGKATRVGHKVVDGKTVRVCKCGAVLDKKFEKTAKAEKTEKTAKKAVKTENAEKTAEKKPAKTAEKKAIKATSAKTRADKVVANVKRGEA